MLDGARDWASAREACKTFGSDLPSIHSEEVNEDLNRWLHEQLDARTINNAHEVWLGASLTKKFDIVRQTVTLLVCQVSHCGVVN